MKPLRLHVLTVVTCWTVHSEKGACVDNVGLHYFTGRINWDWRLSAFILLIWDAGFLVAHPSWLLSMLLSYKLNCFRSEEASVKSQSCLQHNWQARLHYTNIHIHVPDFPLSVSLLTHCLPFFLSHLTLFFSLSHSFSVSFSSHQAAERQIRSWFTVQLNVVIETLLQKKKKKKTACRFHPALIGLPLACACVRTRVLLCVFVLLCVSNALVGTSRLRFFFTFKEGRLKFRLCVNVFAAFVSFLSFLLRAFSRPTEPLYKCWC